MKPRRHRMIENVKASLKAKVEVFQERAWKHDEEGSFPVENINDLREMGYTSLTVPREYGGEEISLFQLVELQKILGRADGSTALSIGWHMGLVKHLHQQQSWEAEIYQAFCKDVVDNGALINNAATEPATGSPTRGGKPETIAKNNGSKWTLNGRKTFTTMSPVLDYFGVSASIEGTDQVANFLIPGDSKGLSIEETWDSIAMRATASHDLVLKDVSIKKEYLVENLTKSKKAANGWLLHIPACYLGIAEAAQQYAIDFAQSYSPNSINGTIGELPNVKQKIGEMELRRLQSEHFLYSVAKKWDESTDEERQKMKPELAAAKHSIVNHAIDIVDVAMRVVGAKSLSKKNPLQRYYRDVRAGLHNPPMDDMTIFLLAAHAMEKEG